MNATTTGRPRKLASETFWSLLWAASVKSGAAAPALMSMRDSFRELAGCAGEYRPAGRRKSKGEGRRGNLTDTLLLLSAFRLPASGLLLCYLGRASLLSNRPM